MQNVNVKSEEFGIVLNCAIRYALGRKTYVPQTVVNFIKPLLPKISDKTLSCMEHDIVSAKNYGNINIDKPIWLEFLNEIQAEQIQRHGNRVSM